MQVYIHTGLYFCLWMICFKDYLDLQGVSDGDPQLIFGGFGDPFEGAGKRMFFFAIDCDGVRRVMSLLGRESG